MMSDDAKRRQKNDAKRCETTLKNATILYDVERRQLTFNDVKRNKMTPNDAKQRQMTPNNANR